MDTPSFAPNLKDLASIMDIDDASTDEDEDTFDGKPINATKALQTEKKLDVATNPVLGYVNRAMNIYHQKKEEELIKGEEQNFRAAIASMPLTESQPPTVATTLMGKGTSFKSVTTKQFDKWRDETNSLSTVSTPPFSIDSTVANDRLSPNLWGDDASVDSLVKNDNEAAIIDGMERILKIPVSELAVFDDDPRKSQVPFFFPPPLPDLSLTIPPTVEQILQPLENDPLLDDVSQDNQSL